MSVYITYKARFNNGEDHCIVMVKSSNPIFLTWKALKVTSMPTEEECSPHLTHSQEHQEEEN